TGAPTGPGTVTNTPGFMATGLTGLTAYEVYVLADCGGLQSIWAGPFTFNTDVQLNFTIDCTVGPQTVNYCYDSNDTNVFTFTSSDGSPLNFIINSGNVENNWDELVVLDSDGTTDLNAATPYGNAGDVGGISYQSTGDTISFQVTSDGSISCQSSATINPLNITVACATCINPSATFVVVDDCANGNQFLVDVNITSLGDATSLSIEDNQGNPPVSVSTTGTTQFGPYPFNTDIIFTVSNEQDVNCVITSSAILLAACPPDNDNCIDATVAAVNDDDTCTLTTPGTILEATDSGVPTGGCTGNPDDDVWFEFTALDEVSVISLLNIQGGTTNLDFGIYEGTCGTLVELECYDATSGVSPLLTVGNTYYIRVFSGGSVAETSTFDLCIQEAPSGTICENAGSFCDNNGTQTAPNITGFPSSGQIACLFSTPNPSWNIIQIGNPGLIEIQIDQVGANGNGLDVDFVLWGPFDAATDFCDDGVLDQDCGTQNCPNNTTNPNFYPSGNIIDCSYSAASTENLTIDNALSGEIYILLVTNFSGQPGDIQIQQTNSNGTGAGSTVAELEVEIETVDATFIDEDNDETTPSVANLCGFTQSTLMAESPFADTYEWYQNGIFLPGETSDTLLVTESDSYTVIAYDAECNVTAQDTKIINFYQEAVANMAQDIVTCDDESGDGIEDFDLEAQTSTILGTQDPAEFVVTYHISLADAQSGDNALTSPYSAMDGTLIFVRVEDVDAVGSGSGCASTNTIFNLVISGPLPTANGVNMELCDDETRDGVEAFDLESNSPNILNGQDPAIFTVTYHETQMDADTGANALVSPYTNTSNPQTIYARVENSTATDCYKTTTFDLIVNDIPETTFDSSILYEVCPNASVPITVTATGDNYTESEVTITWFNEGVVVSGQTDLTIDNVLTAGIYTIEVMFNDTGCTSSEDIEVFELDTCIIPQGISPNGDGLNDTFDLSSYDVQTLTIFNRNGVKVYEKANYTNE
ncbi:T9SS type B sorting domain-containing protein, partial [Lacinutrix chionoecetis]